ncbi:solute carrier family 22 member 18 [Ciona intestinalis]
MVNFDKNRIILLSHLNVTLYALCFWIQIGTLPYLTQKFDVDPITFGNLQTTFAVVQLMGGPLFGRFGDLFGCKYALALAFLSAFLSYFLLGVANTVFIIFLSRLPSVFMHAMQGAQMVITDLTEPSERPDKLGKLGLSYAIGMVLGPVIGGWCTTYANEQVAAFVAACGSLLSIALVVLFIPSNTKGFILKENTEKTSKKSKKLLDFDVFTSLIWKNPSARKLLFVKMLSGLPVGILHGMFSMIALNHFHLSAEANGYVLSYAGFLSIISQGLVIGRLTKRGFNEWSLINGCVAVLCVSNALMSILVTGVIGFCISLIPMVVAGAVFSTVIQAMLTKTVQSEDTGSMLGVSMAVHSLIRSVSPTIGGFLFQYYGFWSFGAIGFLCNGLLLAYLLVNNPR